MIGAYQTWEYAPPGFLEDLLPWAENSAADYDFEDFYEGIISALRWSGVSGEPTGTGGLWALPVGFEVNNMAVNRRILEEAGFEVPEIAWTTCELLEVATQLQHFGGPDTYAFGARGSRNWATIHPGYISLYTGWGATDFKIEDGQLVSQFDSPEAIAATDYWINLIRVAGSPQWTTQTWMLLQPDLGAGNVAIVYDCDTLYFYAQGPEIDAGNIVIIDGPIPPGKEHAVSNLWVWSLAMNASSNNKDAAWMFLRYFTGKEYQHETMMIDAPRRSTFEHPRYREMNGHFPGFLESFERTVEHTTMRFTPHANFFEVTTEWAAMLQEIYYGNFTTEEGMRELKRRVDIMVADLE
jgi:multiple sugar transport system substrate-binding protein